MASAKIFRINYKSDFILTLVSDAGWMTPFCIKFFTGSPMLAYYVSFDGETYTHCAPVDGEPTKLLVQFDDHHLPIGDLKFQIAYHFTVADFPNDTEDEVLNQANITTEIDGEGYQVMLDFTGETAPEIQFSLPAYANEAQRIENEQQRIANEEQRIENEQQRIANEETRQENEAQRIRQEDARVEEYIALKEDAVAATRDANDAATLANQKAQLAQDKADLAQAAATLANQKAQLAADKAALANAAAQLANEKAALAQQKAEYAQQQGGYAKDQGDYAKNQGDYAKEQGDTALADHQRAEADHGIAVDDHTQAGNDHTRAESDHGIAVDDHTQAGNDHTRAESDHGIAADDHTQAGNDHTRAESDHGIAADDHTQAGNDHTRAESDHTRAESDHAAVEVYVDSLGAFDISAYNATGGVLAKYADLTAALGTNGANIPDALRKGGMSVKFVLSSDNNYVQYRYMLPYGGNTTAENNKFKNPNNWQGVDEEPIPGSKNLVESGGVEKYLAREVTNVDNPTKVKSSMSTSGVVNSSSSDYYLVRPVALNPGDTFIVNQGNSTYIGSGLSLLYKTDENGNWIENIITRDTAGGNTISNAKYKNTTSSIIYVGTCTYSSQAKYSIEHLEMAASVVEVEKISSDITDMQSSITDMQPKLALRELQGTKWDKELGKDDYDYKARLTSGGEESSVGTVYNLIYEVADRVHVSALISDDFKMLVGLYRTFDGAKGDVTADRIEYIGSTYPSSKTLANFRYGDSTAKKGYLAVSIRKSDDSAITNANIQSIEQSLELSIFPLTNWQTIDSIQRDIIELKGSSLSINSLELYTCDSNGRTDQEKVRLKFFRQGIIANKNISVDISDAIEAVPSLVYGVEIQSTLTGAKANSSATRLQTVVSAWVNTNSTDALITSNGILNIFFKKSDNSAFTYNEIVAVKNSLVVTISPTEEADNEESDNYDELPIGEFVNLTDAVVASSYVSCVPHLGVKYTFLLPAGIKARVSYGANANISNNTSWVENEGSVTLPSTAICQRINISRVDDSNLTASDISAYVAGGGLKVLYNKIDESINIRNYENEKYVKSAIYRLGFSDSADITAHAGVPSVPTIVHTSDIHGDMKRFENAMEYAKLLGADTVVTTGDNVLLKPENGTLFLKEIIEKYPGIPLLTCIGNHEVLHSSGEVFNNEYQFNNFISPYVTQGNYKSSDNTSASMPYYFVDLASANLRIIVINQFDSGCYNGEGLGGRLGQEQIIWFCNTLLSTPEGYGVIIAMHANEGKIVTPEAMSAWNQTVNWDGRDEDIYGYCKSGLYVNAIHPIKTIVDAFISKTALSTTYEENTTDGNNGETVTINVDFSNVATGVEFICYLTGHRHKDNIGYVDNTTNKQLILNIVCTNCHYPRGGSLSFSEGCDISRGDRGSVQDAFNVYGIDRQNGRVKIARVGSNVNFEGIERKFLMAPYRD